MILLNKKEHQIISLPGSSLQNSHDCSYGSEDVQCCRMIIVLLKLPFSFLIPSRIPRKFFTLCKDYSVEFCSIYIHVRLVG